MASSLSVGLWADVLTIPQRKAVVLYETANHPPSCPYSAECVEGLFCELRVDRILRRSPYPTSEGLVGVDHRVSRFGARGLRIGPHGLNTASTKAMSSRVGETSGGKIRLPTASEAGSPTANLRPCSAFSITSGRNPRGTSPTSTTFSASLSTTHQYLMRPHLVPRPSTTPLARHTRPVAMSGQTANNSSARKQSALVCSSPRRAVKTRTPMTTSMPIQAPAEAMC